MKNHDPIELTRDISHQIKDLEKPAILAVLSERLEGLREHKLVHELSNRQTAFVAAAAVLAITGVTLKHHMSKRIANITELTRDIALEDEPDQAKIQTTQRAIRLLSDFDWIQHNGKKRSASRFIIGLVGESIEPDSTITSAEVRDFGPKRDMSFIDQGNCISVENPEVFLGGKGKKQKQQFEAEAKAICNGTQEVPECPVIRECLKYSIEYNEPGVWGGMTEKERKAYARTLA